MLTAKEIMSSQVFTVKLDTPISEVAHIFHEQKISGAPVVDDDNHLIGIITESDLIDQNKKLHIPTVVAIFDAVIYLESLKNFEKELKKMTGSKVRNVYSSKVTSVDIDTPINEIASIMADKHFHTLPVLDKGKIAGIVGKDDIIKTMASTQPS
ncbi:MAG: CBS domain-containing protein [Proteobacteria bacterium]|nr:CBS domain-containing protein [Pseudomonadota bacterium]